MSPEALKLSDALRGELATFAREAHPHEACALLMGMRSQILRARLCRNVADKPRTAFRVDPVEQLAVELEARAEEVDIIGVWHSHPSGPATPSDVDRAAAWPGYVYLISGTGEEGNDELRAFDRGSESFAEVPIEASRKREARTN